MSSKSFGGETNVLGIYFLLKYFLMFFINSQCSLIACWIALAHKESTIRKLSVLFNY